MPITSENSLVSVEAPASEAPASKAKYWTVAEHLRQQVQCGAMKAGDRVPSMSTIQARFGVSLGTVQKVHDLLEQEGLIVREQGRGTFVADARTRRTGLIGFIGSIFSTTSQFPVSMHLAEGIREVLEREELRLLMLDATSPLGWDKVDGLLICAPGQIEEVSRDLPAHLPQVSLLASLSGKSSVVADDFGGARDAVAQLVAQGHRRIACLMEREPLISQERVRGYHAGLREAGIEPQACWMRRIERFGLEDYRVWSRRNLENWLREDWKESGCTALLAQNDSAAIGVVMALQEAGLSVPQDVSVIGFDGTELCNYIMPHLSAVEIPLRQIGAEGTELLLRHIEQPDRMPQTITLPMRFQARQSVRQL